jgi:hypothetical protein
MRIRIITMQDTIQDAGEILLVNPLFTGWLPSVIESKGERKIAGKNEGIRA